MFIPAESLNSSAILDRYQSTAPEDVSSGNSDFAAALEAAGSSTTSAEQSVQGNMTTEVAGLQDKAREFLSDVFNKQNSGTLSEEELYAAVTYTQLSEKFGQDAADTFKDQLTSNLDANRRVDGYTPVEHGVHGALQQLIDDDIITVEEAETLNGEAFAAAQLDNNTEELWDHLGSTQAVAQLEASITSAYGILDKIASEDIQAASRTLTLNDDMTGSSASSLSSVSDPSTTVDGAGSLSGTGIIWKPVSESDHKLVIVLPSSEDPEISLYTPDGSYIETGDDKGLLSETDSRRVYRFNLPGASYPDGTLVQIGSTTYQIDNTSSRYN